MKIEIKSHSYKIGETNYRADCYPFVNNKPISSIADCSFCKKNNPEAEYCDGWIDEPENSPIFCGPICPRFDLVDSMVKLLGELQDDGCE